METSKRNEGTTVIRRILELLLVVFIVLKLTELLHGVGGGYYLHYGFH